MDRQKPAHNSHLPCRLWHGGFALPDESGQDPRRRGTRLCGVGDTCIRQRAVRAERQHPADAARPARTGYAQAPPIPQRVGHWRQRRGKNTQLCAAEYPDRKHELRHYGPEIRSAACHGRLPQRAGLRRARSEPCEFGTIGRLQSVSLSARRKGRAEAGQQPDPVHHPEGQPRVRPILDQSRNRAPAGHHPHAVSGSPGIRAELLNGDARAGIRRGARGR